jgi:hypothetical protein
MTISLHQFSVNERTLSVGTANENLSALVVAAIEILSTLLLQPLAISLHQLSVNENLSKSVVAFTKNLSTLVDSQ